MNGTILAPVLCMRFNVKATISTGGLLDENDDDERTACRNHGERQYTLVGDYYFPTCMLADRSPNGKWASLYERYLQEKHPHEYVRLIWADELAALLESVQKECEERVEVLVREMAEVEGVDEEMKENEQMEWVRRMEMICGRAEEIVRGELMG